MSDYNFDVDILRGQMARVLSDNEEQFAFVITEAISKIDISEAIELGQLGDDADADTAIANLRALADAIEAGQLS
ncbi:hypothetical protein [Roseovarius atlanticus]|uniref:hypothetical protein n=1 Tax=Roseovarius atlanticus TaxID=1641875 RepID=UPI001C976D03|nr:hypothetical protein [Roseovarius atlanticus]MBY5988229.1 hypothetical protein [Roseovarius atlanticus]MBY6123620.1 hypothetical protein [Roseovarius atlanticus]MBY6148115.1 hypothetical protein [Roseovarius atlanticus]